MTEWTVYARDASRNWVAQVDDYQSLELIPRFNAVGSWSITLDRRLTNAVHLTTPGYGIEVVRDGTTVMSGPIKLRKHHQDADSRDVTISGPDDLVWLARRLVSPAPAEHVPPYTSAAYDVRTGTCSTILRQYVDVNAGSSSITERRVTGLTIGTDPAAGSSVTGRGRWQQLLVLLQELAVSGGGLGFRVRSMEFQVYAPSDKTEAVMFSAELGNLAGFEYESEAPDATYIYVGGGGEGTARTIYEQQDSAAAVTWGRAETFVDRRDTTATAELGQAATEALEEGGERTSLSIVPIDTEGMAYGEHYDLGDKVTVVVEGADAGTIQEIIREVKITLSPDGPTAVVPVIGSPGRHDIFRLFREFRRVVKRVSGLERR